MGDNYISQKSVPFQRKYADYGSLGDHLPVLFGTEDFTISNDSIYIDSDVFAACFFMLTRWEEIVDTDKDLHDRSQAKNAVAYKWGFLNRPVVDEFADLLWNSLVHLGYKGKRKEHQFELIHTHDVDEIQKWDGRKTVRKTIAADIIKRKSAKLARENLKQVRQTRKGLIKDPYDTFEELMQLSEGKGVKSEFYFLHYGTHELDRKYKWDNPLVPDAINLIRQRGHKVGLHPSYNTYNDTELFASEKQEFIDRFDIEPTSGRQHFLRFSVPETWQIWEDNGMECDSTMYYSEQLGFRCGTCRKYPVFNVKTREVLRLMELPTTFMDVTFFNRIENGESDQLLLEIDQLIALVKKHRGQFVLLWHTNYLNLNVFEDHKAFYLELLKRF